MTESASRTTQTMRILSAVFLLATGGIHIFLVFAGVGGILGVMFVLNGIAGIALAVGMLVLREGLLQLTTVLGLLFLIVTLGALLLALTVGLFGIHQTWDFLLVPQTVIIETIGIAVLAVMTRLVIRPGGDPRP